MKPAGVSTPRYFLFLKRYLRAITNVIAHWLGSEAASTAGGRWSGPAHRPVAGRGSPAERWAPRWAPRHAAPPRVPRDLSAARPLAARRHARRRPRASHPRAGAPQPARRPAPPGAAAGRVTVTKHFLRRNFCLVIVFQETAPQLGVHSTAAAAVAESRSHQCVFPGRSSAAARSSLGPSAGRGLAARGEQPRALLSGLGHRVLRAASFPACGPVTAGPAPSAAVMGTDSRAAGALLARASTLHLQTGNLLNWGRLRKKCPSTHSEEVRAASAPAETGSRDRPRAGPGGSAGGWSGSGRRGGRGRGAHLGSACERKPGLLSARCRVRTCCWGPLRLYKFGRCNLMTSDASCQCSRLMTKLSNLLIG